MSTSEVPGSAGQATEGMAGAEAATATSAAESAGRNGAWQAGETRAMGADVAVPQTEPWARLVLEAMLGGALEGADLLPRLLQAGARTAASSGEGQVAVEPHAPRAVQAALGLGEELGSGLRRSLVATRRAAGRLQRPRLRPPVLVEMALAAGEIAMDQGWMAVDRWARRGQREEARARLVARLLASGAFDAVLIELMRHPEVRALIEQQGKDLATTTLEEIRQRAGDVDGAVERAAKRLLHLQERE